jgi:hypothetical protein
LVTAAQYFTCWKECVNLLRNAGPSKLCSVVPDKSKHCAMTVFLSKRMPSPTCCMSSSAHCDIFEVAGECSTVTFFCVGVIGLPTEVAIKPEVSNLPRETWKLRKAEKVHCWITCFISPPPPHTTHAPLYRDRPYSFFNQ